MLNKTSKNIILAGIVVVIILFAAKLIFSPSDVKDKQTITSTGTAEITTTPDLVEIYSRIEVLKDTAQEAEEASKDLSNKVLEAAKSFKDAKVETLSYNIRKREDYTEQGRLFRGYTAIYSLKISTQNFDQVGQLIDSIVASGANNIDNIQFTLTKEKEDEIKNEALKQAGEQAKKRADSIAQGLGLKVGKLLQVSESNIYPRPFIMEAAVADVSRGAPVAELNFEPRDIKVSATINVIYSIK